MYRSRIMLFEIPVQSEIESNRDKWWINEMKILLLNKFQCFWISNDEKYKNETLINKIMPLYT